MFGLDYNALHLISIQQTCFNERLYDGCRWPIEGAHAYGCSRFFPYDVDDVTRKIAAVVGSPGTVPLCRAPINVTCSQTDRLFV